MSSLFRRNLMVFFKDKTSVFFSLLAVFIIIALYALFLGDVWSGTFQGMPGAGYLMDCWISAGILAVASVTTTMGAFGTMVDDKVKKIDKDIRSSPLKRSAIAAAYILSAFAIGVIMTLVALVLSQAYILLNGGKLLEMRALFKVLGIILLSVFNNTAIVLFMVSFFKSANAFATASTIIGTLIGFLTGVYLPIGQLPEAVQWVVRIFPASHGASLLRQVMMSAPISVTFAGAPAEAVERFSRMMGVTLTCGDRSVITAQASAAYLAATAAIFFVLSIIRLSRKNK